MRLDFHGKRGKFKFKSKTYRSEGRYSSRMALKFPVQYRQSKSCSIICHATCSSRREVKACYMCFPSSDSKGESLVPSRSWKRPRTRPAMSVTILTAVKP